MKKQANNKWFDEELIGVLKLLHCDILHDRSDYENFLCVGQIGITPILKFTLKVTRKFISTLTAISDLTGHET